MCRLNYKEKEEEGRELKLHRIIADKKLRKVRWSPLIDTGQKSDVWLSSLFLLLSFSFFFQLLKDK